MDDRRELLAARLAEVAAAGWILTVRRDGKSVVVNSPTPESFFEALGPAPTLGNPVHVEVMWTRK